MPKKQEITAIIPARGGSKGVPKKNIRLLAGKPLIAYTIEAAQKSKYINEIIVSTEDREIAKVSEALAVSVMPRPKKLARDNTSTIEVVLHTLTVLRKKQGYIPNLTIVLQPTSPLRTAKDIDAAINIFLKNNFGSLVSVCQPTHSPYWNFRIDKGFLEPVFNRKYLEMRRQDLPPLYFSNGAIYLSTPKNFQKHKSLYCPRMGSYLMSSWASIQIDSEIDFLLAEIVIKNAFK
jgi:CMP-N-acetylneuraminic acid synthetase